MIRRLSSYWLVALFLTGSLGFARADEPTEEKPSVETTTETEKPVETETESPDWEALAARKLEIAKQLKQISDGFNAAPVERKRELREEFTNLIAEFRGEIEPEMKKLAPEVFEKDPTNRDAGEFVLQAAWDENRYSDAVKAADRLIENGHATKLAYNLGGAANFASNNFDRAVELLSEAEAKKLLDFRSGGNFLEPAREYQELWKAELAIREKEAAAEGDEKLPRVELQTSRGKVVLELFENEAPNTVANFISLIESGHYDGTKFHRVIPNFMIQGGDINSKNDDPADDGAGDVGYTIECECFQENARMHFAGSLSMAKKSPPDTGGAQFFITHLPTHWLNGNAETKTGHTVFGRVVEGMDVVSATEQGDVIEKATVLFKRDHEYVPEKIVSDTEAP